MIKENEMKGALMRGIKEITWKARKFDELESDLKKIEDEIAKLRKSIDFLVTTSGITSRLVKKIAEYDKVSIPTELKIKKDGTGYE